MSTLFISDLHLDPQRPAISRAFFNLLEGPAANVERLYILGDFFEAWIGDDDGTALSQEVISSLRRYSDSGPAVFFMHGNRDFLVGQDFCQRTGCQLLPAPSVIDLYGKPVLLMHGDSLCTRDKNYMAFRQQLRDPGLQQMMLEKPLVERRDIARQLRESSREANSNKADDIMDVTPEEVVRALEEHQVDLFIHGHTHRPHIHQLQTSLGAAQRIVLGDWGRDGWYLQFEQDLSFELKQFAIA